MKALVLRTIVLGLSIVSTPLSAGWSYSTKTDPMTDVVTRKASVLTVDNKSAIIVRCKEGQTNSKYNLEMYVQTNHVVDGDQVVFRIDRNASRRVNTNRSTDYRAQFISNFNDKLLIIKELKAGQKVRVEVGKYVGNAMIYSYSLVGSTRAINKVLAGCAMPVADVTKVIEDNSPEHKQWIADREKAMKKAQEDFNRRLNK